MARAPAKKEIRKAPKAVVVKRPPARTPGIVVEKSPNGGHRTRAQKGRKYGTPVSTPKVGQRRVSRLKGSASAGAMAADRKRRTTVVRKPIRAKA